MNQQAINIEKTSNGYEVFGHRFQTLDDAESFLWAEQTQSKLRSEQFHWASLRDIAQADESKKAGTADERFLEEEIARRIERNAGRHRSWIVATVVVFATVILASVWLSTVHPAGKWFFLAFFAWWFLLERTFWRCPACDLKIAPGLYNGANALHRIGECPGCGVSFSAIDTER